MCLTRAMVDVFDLICFQRPFFLSLEFCFSVRTFPCQLREASSRLLRVVPIIFATMSLLMAPTTYFAK